MVFQTTGNRWVIYIWIGTGCSANCYGNGFGDEDDVEGTGSTGEGTILLVRRQSVGHYEHYHSIIYNQEEAQRYRLPSNPRGSGSRVLRFIHIPGSRNVADILTKPLRPQVFSKLVRPLMFAKPPVESDCGEYQKTKTREQGKITVNGNPTSTGVRDGNGETFSVGMHESHTAHDRL